MRVDSDRVRQPERDMSKSARALTVLFLGLGYSGTALSATYSYRLTEIPLNQVPGLTTPHGRAINDAGHVTGIAPSCTSDGCWHAAFLWDGTTSFLNLLPSSPVGET